MEDSNSRESDSTATNYRLLEKSSISKVDAYQRFFQKRWILVVAFISCLLAIVIASVQISLMVKHLGHMEGFEYPTLAFEKSGIGIVAAIVSVITFGYSIRTSCSPSYIKLLLTFGYQVVSMCVHAGLIVFALSSPLPMIWWGPYSREALTRCNCFDSDGNVERNGTDPTNWYCRDDYRPPRLTCDVIDKRIADADWTETLLVTMISFAVFQCIFAVIPMGMAVRTLWRVSATFDKSAITKVSPAGGDHVQKNFYHDYFPVVAAKKICWMQIGFNVFTIIMTISVMPRMSLPWNFVQLCSIGSFLLLLWATLPGTKFTYLKLSGVVYAHLISTLCMAILLVLLTTSTFGPRMENLTVVAVPFVLVEMVASFIVFIMSIQPILKIEKHE